MESLFERHDEYVNTIRMDYVREMMNRIDWSTRLFAIRGAKGVGKSTLMLQYIRSHFAPDDRHVLYISADTSYFARHSLVEVADKFVKEGGQYQPALHPCYTHPGYRYCKRGVLCESIKQRWASGRIRRAENGRLPY